MGWNGRHALFCAPIALVLLALMAPTFDAVLRNDDYYHIARAEMLTSHDGAMQVFLAAQSDYAGAAYGWSANSSRSDYYRPLVDVSFALDHRLYGLWQPGYRATNFLIALAAALAVSWLCRLRTGNLLAATVAGLIFTTCWVHQNTIVNQIAGRTDSVVGAFVLVAAAAFAAFRLSGLRRYAVLALASVGCGLLSKETGVGAPAICLLWDICFTRPLDLRKLRFHVMSFGLLAAYLLLRVILFDGLGATNGELGFRLSKLDNILRLPLATLLPPLGMLHPAINPTWSARITTLFGLAILILAARPLMRSASLRWGAVFGIGAFFLASLPAPLLPQPHASRFFFGASGFVSLLFCEILFAGSMNWGPDLPRRFRTVGACILAAAVGSAGAWVIAASALRGRAASVATSRIIASVEGALADAAAGDRVLLVAVPAACGRHGVFYNGFQEWVRLRFQGRIEPYVLSTTLYRDCVSVPTRVIAQGDGRFTVELAGTGAAAELALSQTDLALLAVGESVENRFERVTLTGVGSYRTWGHARPTMIDIEVRIEPTAQAGRDYVFYADLEAVYQLETDGSWVRIGANERSAFRQTAASARGPGP